MGRWMKLTILVVLILVSAGKNHVSAMARPVKSYARAVESRAAAPGLALSDQGFFPKGRANEASDIALSPVTTLSMAALMPLQDIVQVVSGWYHICALTTTGGVKCWGQNLYGQLGDGTTVTRLAPVDVLDLQVGAKEIAAGGGRTCALMKDGGVRCWGTNWGGHVGDGTTETRLTPVDVIGLTAGVIALAAGLNHACALTNLGGVKCWGDNSYGQLGDGTTEQRLTPVDVNGLTSDVATISAGAFHTCAITKSGVAKCWGDNANGALGDGTTTRRLAPMNVLGLDANAARITAGYGYTCALTTGGRAKCWGGNRSGELGDGTTLPRFTPVDVLGLINGTKGVAAGWNHTCAVDSEDRVRCWGENARGQLGDGTTAQRSVPSYVSDLPAGEVSLLVSGSPFGAHHSCAVTTSGNVKCWGDNTYSRLGNGNLGYHTAAVDVIGLNSITAVSSEQRHSCALTNTGGVKCWGSNSYGQLGDGTTELLRTSAVDVVGLASGVKTVSVTEDGSCALMESGGVKCWGDTVELTHSATPKDITGLTEGIKMIVAGAYHLCALTADDGVRCLGQNDYGQLGDGTSTSRPTPVGVIGLGSNVKAIGAGRFHTCAALHTGGVKCWGRNDSGQLGDGSTLNRPSPVNVLEIENAAVALAGGSAHTCVLTSDYGIKCWGLNYSGQLGDGTTVNQLTPVNVSGLTSSVAALTAGFSHTCALTTSNDVMCWGYNGYGQLGDGSITNRPAPAYVSEVRTDVRSISGGEWHTCATTNVGGVKCWGNNFFGQLGIGIPTWTTTPTDVLNACFSLTISHLGLGVDPTSSPGKSVGCPTGLYAPGETINLLATPAAGWRVAGWSGTSNDASTASTNTLIMPTADMTVSVYYEEIPSNPGDAYEPDNTCAQANALAPDGSTQMHTFHVAGDHDWVRFNVIANRRYVITARALGTLVDLVLVPHRSCDDPTATPWDGFGRDQVLAWVADSTGTVYLRLQNRDPAIFGSGAEYQVSVREVSTGAVVIVGGRQANPEHLQAQINFMTNRAYTIFQQAGYTHDNIYYLSADPVLQPHVDGPSVSANLGYAITAWAASRTQDGEPLYIYLSDHGQVEGFFVNTNDVATTRQLEGWLLAFEQQRPNSPVIVIVEACKSGSLITPAHTLAKPGRVIVTATGEANDAYARDAGQGGGHFSDPFFSALAQGYSIWDSYQLATQAVSTLNLTVGYNQTPWIDGDGDGIPYPLDADDLGAGRQFGLARAPGPGLSGQAPYIVQPEQPVLAGVQSVTIEVQVLDESRVMTAVWMEVTKPSTLPPSPPPGYTTPVSHAERIDLTYNPLTDRFQVDFTFDEVGMYQLIFQAEDADGQRGQPVALTVSSGSRVYLPLVLR